MPLEDFVSRAVLFDFDGVLADTMMDNLRAWEAVLGEVGVQIDPEEYLVLEGMKLVDVAKTLCMAHGVRDGDWEAIVQKKDAYFAAHNSFRFYPGVEELLQRLTRKAVPFALVSAGRLPRLQRILPPSFLDQFQAVVTGEKTTRGKPFPDPYRTAMEELKTQPRDCLAVENAPLGIKSAQAAGARCVAISSTLSEDRLATADAVVQRFSDLLTFPPIATIIS